MARDLAAIVELGVEDAVFAAPASVDDGPEVARALSADRRVGLSVRSAGTDELVTLPVNRHAVCCVRAGCPGQPRARGDARVNIGDR